MVTATPVKEKERKERKERKDKGEKRVFVPLDVFCRQYTKLCRDGKDIQQIADTLGLSVNGVIARANNIRTRQLEQPEKDRKFVLPKPKRRPRSGIDLNELNAMLAKEFGVHKDVVMGSGA